MLGRHRGTGAGAGGRRRRGAGRAGGVKVTEGDALGRVLEGRLAKVEGDMLKGPKGDSGVVGGLGGEVEALEELLLDADHAAIQVKGELLIRHVDQTADDIARRTERLH